MAVFYRSLLAFSFLSCSLVTQADTFIGFTHHDGSGERTRTPEQGYASKSSINGSQSALKVGFGNDHSRLEFSAVQGTFGGLSFEGFGFDWYVAFGRYAVKPYLVAGGGFYYADIGGHEHDTKIALGYGVGAGLFWRVVGPLELEAGYRWGGITWGEINNHDVTDRMDMASAGMRLRF